MSIFGYGTTKQNLLDAIQRELGDEPSDEDLAALLIVVAFLVGGIGPITD